METQRQSQGKRHEPLVLRLTRWSSALAIVAIAVCACRIHGDIELGGSLAAAQQWQLAAFWLLAQNALVYVVYFAFSKGLRGRIAAFSDSLAESRKGASPAGAGLASWQHQAAFRA